MGGCLGFCDDRGQRAPAAVWGAGLTQAFGRCGPWLRSLGPQSRTRKQRPGAPGGAFQLLLCENDHHSCRPGPSCESPPLRRGPWRWAGPGTETRGGLQMQVDGVGGGPWESFKESSRPPGSSARSGGQLAQRGGAAVPAVETQAALQGAALAVLLWSGGGPAREGPAAGQPWGRGWRRLRPPGAGLSPRPSGALGSGQASRSLCHSPCTEVALAAGCSFGSHRKVGGLGQASGGGRFRVSCDSRLHSARAVSGGQFEVRLGWV